MDKAEILKKVPLFKGLDKDEFEALSRVVLVRNLSKKQMLFLEGEPASGFYILIEGRISIFKENAEGKQYTIHIISPGQFFAEAAIFDGDHFPANSLAIEESVVGFFPKGDFLELIKKYPGISLKIIGSMSRFLREYNLMVEDLALKEVSARVARYILQRAQEENSHRIRLNISKAELARYLGTISETLSRNLKRLKDDKIIDVKSQEITILEMDALSRIAESEHS